MLLLLSGCAKQGISPQSRDVHQLYLVIMALALPVFLAVEGLLIWCIVRYRKRGDGEAAPQSVGGTRSLAVFFAIPALIVAVLFPFGESTLMKIQESVTPQVKIKVEGFQWEWTFLYLNEGIFEAGQTLVKPAVMVLPVDEPVQITLTSRDVIHSFFVPDLLVQAGRDPGTDDLVRVHAGQARHVPRTVRRVLRALSLEDDVLGPGGRRLSTTRRGSSSSARPPRA